MIAFEVWVDGKHRGTAGTGDTGVLTATTLWVRRADGSEDLRFDVGGLVNPTDSESGHNAYWVTEDLHVGSEIRVRVVETDHVDPPKRTTDPRTHEDDEQEERRTYERLRAKFEGNK